MCVCMRVCFDELKFLLIIISIITVEISQLVVITACISSVVQVQVALKET